MSDFFVPDVDVPPPGVSVMALPSVGEVAEVALAAHRNSADRARGEAGGFAKARRRRVDPRRADCVVHRLPSRPGHSGVATGLVAHDICSKTFVSGLDPQTVLAETTDRAGISLLRWGLDYRLDRTGETVDASLGGLLGSRAAFHEGFECVLLHGPDEPYLLKSDIAGGPEQALAFAWRELFNPLGMRNVTLEFDGAGTLQGSSYMLASARDSGAFWTAISERWCDRRSTYSTRRLGRLLSRRNTRYRLRRRLLDQS